MFDFHRTTLSQRAMHAMENSACQTRVSRVV